MADFLDDAELTGTISTARHTEVRFRAGHECGDLFEEGDEFDGLTLTIEVSGLADAVAMLQAITDTPEADFLAAVVVERFGLLLDEGEE